MNILRDYRLLRIVTQAYYVWYSFPFVCSGDINKTSHNLLNNVEGTTKSVTANSLRYYLVISQSQYKCANCKQNQNKNTSPKLKIM